jgi:hypothetical protein
MSFSPLPGRENESGRKDSIAVAKRGDSVRLTAKNFRFSARASVERDTTLITTNSTGVRETETSDAMLEVSGPDAPPTNIGISFRSDQRHSAFPVLRPVKMSFVEIAYDTSGEVQAFSSLENANLTFTETGRSYELFRGASVTLDKLDGALRLELRDEGLQFHFRGTASVVTLGEDDSAAGRDIRPRLAERISRDKTLALLWSSLIFLAGLVLTVQRSIRG